MSYTTRKSQKSREQLQLINVMNADLTRCDILDPFEEERHITGIVEHGAGMRLTSTPVSAKALDFGLRKHKITSVQDCEC